MLNAFSDVLSEPPPARAVLRSPFPQGSLEALGATCSQALPPPAPCPGALCHCGFPPGERRRQVSLTTLPPSSLGRCWPGFRNHITDGEEPSGFFWVSRLFQREEGGSSPCHQPPPLPTCSLEAPLAAIGIFPGAHS